MSDKKQIPIGILFSHSGAYSALGREGFEGAMAAIRWVNARKDLSFELSPVCADPQGNTDRYASLCDELISQNNIRHIVGCTTSWSRKEVIPVVEKREALLWYPCVYEGFEASDKVVYVAACANQHLVPLINYILPRYGNKAVLLGSNYIWGWEMNRIAREMLAAANGSVLAERYIAINDTDIDHLISEIEIKKPDFILNNLIGSSSYAFLEAYAALGKRNADFTTDKTPVLSCNFYEGELKHVGAAAKGNYTVSCYFNTLSDENNRMFLQATRQQGYQGNISAFFAQSFTSILLIAAGIEKAGTDAIGPVLKACHNNSTETPLGSIIVDERTNHIALPAHIGRAGHDGNFDIVHRVQIATEPDPFMTHTHLKSPVQNHPKPAFLRRVI